MTTTPIDPRLAMLDATSPLASRLAALASLAVRVDAGLLRRLRQALLPEADVGVESDLWFSAIVETRSATGFQIAPEILPALRERLVPGAAATPTGREQVIAAWDDAANARLDRVRAIMAEAHEDASPAIRLEEAVNAIAVAPTETDVGTVDALLRPALRTLAEGGAPALDVARWAMRAGPRMHPRVRETATARTLLLASALSLGMPRIVEAPSAQETPLASIGWALPSLDTLPRRRVGVVFTSTGLQFVAGESSTSPIALPDTDPLLVEVAWRIGQEQHRLTVDATPGTSVALPGKPDEVTLTTLSGDRFRVEARQAAVDVRPTSVTVYTSSAGPDVDDARSAVTQALSDVTNVDFFVYDYQVAPDREQIARLLLRLQQSDLFIAIVGHQYGDVPNDSRRNPKRKSRFELELEHAQRYGIPILCFMLDERPASRSRVLEPKRDSRNRAVRRRILETYLVETFSSTDELKTKVMAAALRWQATRGGPAREASTRTSLTLRITQPSPSELVFATTGIEHHQQIQPTFIESLLQAISSGSGRMPASAIDTLAKLLLPPQIAHAISGSQDLELALDVNAARYPWELFTDSQLQLPLSRARSLIRSLITTRAVDRRVGDPVPMTALVIGSPLTSATFPSLPGAAQEASMVAERLTRSGFRVTSLIQSDARTVISALLQEEWGIVHIASHYQAATGADGDGGIVLSDGTFISAREFAMLRRAPHVVFLNAAHAGSVGASTTTTPQSAAAPADILIALLNQGARAVIAPFLAIDDARAVTFAETFYDQLLRGLPLAEAVRQVRNVMFAREPDDMTWGAYQLYGDADLHLVRESITSLVATPPPRAPATKAGKTKARVTPSKHRPTARKTIARKTTARKTAIRKVTIRKTAARKTTTRKTRKITPRRARPAAPAASRKRSRQKPRVGGKKR